MPTLMFTAYQLIICTHREIRTPINGFGDRHATIAPYMYIIVGVEGFEPPTP